MAQHATFSMRLDTQLLERIDHSASQAGVSRTAYILSHLAEYYDHQAASTQKPTDTPSQRGR